MRCTLCVQLFALFIVSVVWTPLIARTVHIYTDHIHIFLTLGSVPQTQLPALNRLFYALHTCLFQPEKQRSAKKGNNKNNIMHDLQIYLRLNVFG